MALPANFGARCSGSSPPRDGLVTARSPWSRGSGIAFPATFGAGSTRSAPHATASNNAGKSQCVVVPARPACRRLIRRAFDIIFVFLTFVCGNDEQGYPCMLNLVSGDVNKLAGQLLPIQSEFQNTDEFIRGARTGSPRYGRLLYVKRRALAFLRKFHRP